MHVMHIVDTIHRDMRDKLSVAMQQRKLRQEMLPDPTLVRGGIVPAWVLYERKTMLDAVNAERISRQLTAMSDQDFVARCETPACGHVDYYEKFALYCAEAARGQPS